MRFGFWIWLACLIVMMIFVFILHFDSWNGKAKSKFVHVFQESNLEGDSPKHVDQETNQEMHKDSTQSMGLQLDIKFAIILHKNSIKKKNKI